MILECVSCGKEYEGEELKKMANLCGDCTNDTGDESSELGLYGEVKKK